MKLINNETESQKRPKVGVVIGGGGIKTLTAIALFEFLDEAQIEVDLLVGCSGGSILCALKAAGYSPEQMKELSHELVDRRLFSKLNYRAILGVIFPRLFRLERHFGLIRPQGAQALCRRLFGDLRLEELRTETLLQATDAETGESVVLNRGPLADAAYASGALYPIFPPACIEGRYLRDGVYNSPLPVMEAVKRGMDVIITLDFFGVSGGAPRGLIDGFFQCLNATYHSLTSSQMFMSFSLSHHAIIPISIRFDRYITIWDTHEAPAVLEAGQRAVAEHREEILAAIAAARGSVFRAA
jgi:NTE family protein